jgi:2-oxoisovalerate dehydrogenase E1 component
MKKIRPPGGGRKREKAMPDKNSFRPANAIELYRTMIAIRAFECKLKELVYANQVGGAAHLSVGQEAVAAGICAALEKDDVILSTHRGHGHAIAKGADLRRMFAEILGRATGYCRGKGGSMHIADPELGIAGANGIVGGGLTLAAGIALANKTLHPGRVCVCFFGDGAAAQGGLHEALNACALWKLPALYVCENNRFGMSNPTALALATDSVAKWAAGYGLQGAQVDGNDAPAVYAATRKAIEHIRASGTAYLLECLTYRVEGHYCGDPCLYRDKQETRRWQTENDPIKRLKNYLLESGNVGPEELEQCDRETQACIEEAVRQALQDPEPAPESVAADVYVDIASNANLPEPDPNHGVMVEMTYRDAAQRALDEEMARDARVIILGEDVGRHGGAFQVTKGLFDKYGPDRVRDTPISEALIGGCTVGAALAGLRPVGEFQYSDFMTLGMDQIVNQAAKIHYMFGGRMNVPLVFRAPTGSGGRGNAAQHSQSLEAWFMHVPGLKVVIPATPFDLLGLLKTAIRDDDPVIFLEHKALYIHKGPVPVEEYLLPFGRADIKRKGSDLTIIATGRMVIFSLEAAEKLAADGIQAEVIDPRTLVPLDKETICRSAAKTGRAMIVSEDCLTAGVSAEIAAILQEEIFDQLKHPVVRVAGLNAPIPYNRALERLAVPAVETICLAARRALRRG